MAKKHARLRHEEQPATTPTRTPKMVLKDDVPVFYVNSANFELSNWDIKMRMGQIQSADESAVNVAEVVRVFMSHSHAKAFAAALKRGAREACRCGTV
jgi:hypothetical protein